MDTAHSNALGAQRVSTSLYVGDLPVDLPNPEDALFNLFNKVGMVMSIKVCRDISSQRSLGYAYVNFQNPSDAERALEQLNFAEIRPGRYIRVMWSSRDPTARKSGEGNIFVKNLDPSVDIRVLRDKFSTFGNILSLKLATDASGKSLGYGFVHFEKPENAREAIERTNGVVVNGQAIQVSAFVKKVDRQKAEEKVFKTVYVKNLGHEATDEAIKKLFSQFGAVASVFSSGHAQHKTKFSLVTFENHESAVAAIDKLHNQKSELSEGDEKLFVCRALKKRDRQAQKTGTSPGLYQNQGRNIYVKHLDDDMNKERFEELFSRFGKITSSALMHDAAGNFRGFGFVCFEAKEAATAAIREMNGKMLYRRPLYVSQAQQKDMRYQMLEDQRKAMTHQQARINTMQMPAMYGGYPQWGMGPAGFMGRPPMNPFMGPGPFMMQPPPMRQMRPPMMPPQPPQQRQMRGPKMMPPQMMMPHQRYTAPPPQQAHHQAQAQHQAQQQRHAIGVTAQDLANMTPEEQKNALGERLYVRIQEINPQQAAKITGMLLEMDTPEILNVLEERSTLLAKVEEAVAVLQQHVGASN